MFHKEATKTSSAKPLESRFEASLALGILARSRELFSYEECKEETVELITIKKSLHPHVPVSLRTRVEKD